VSLLLFLIVSFLLPVALMAQQIQPPTCCPKASRAPLALNEAIVATLQGPFVVSEEMLLSQGITRRQYVAQLSAALFPDKPAHLALLSKDVLVEANGVDLERLDQIVLTDDVWYIAVNFVR
jgi:hypothetical protein